MPNSISIHIGVNAPGAACHCEPAPLNTCEEAARQMTELAKSKGFNALPPILGKDATPQRVLAELKAACKKLTQADDILLVTFSGHGCRLKDLNGDEALDEAWCLFEELLVDDDLLPLWVEFAAGVRIVLISESCYSGGVAMAPLLEEKLNHLRARTPAEVVSNVNKDPPPECTAPRRRADEFQASLLLLASAREEQTSSEGFFTKALLEVVAKWEEAEVEGTWCQLWAEIGKIVGPPTGKLPHIRLLGADRPGFAFETAFEI